jgi:uncharacterized protein (DUF1786 family)
LEDSNIPAWAAAPREAVLHILEINSGNNETSGRLSLNKRILAVFHHGSFGLLPDDMTWSWCLAEEMLYRYKCLSRKY